MGKFKGLYFKKNNTSVFFLDYLNRKIMSKKFEQISIKQGFMKYNGGILFRNISETEYEFKTTINENHLNKVGITHGGFICSLIDGIDATMGIQPNEDASASTLGKPSD